MNNGDNGMDIIYSLLNKRQSMTTATLFSRQTGNLISQIIDASQVISLTEPSVITINNARGWATGYSRSGDDLSLATQDGTTLQYRHFFAAGSAGTLVFDDGSGPATQAVFSHDAGSSSLTPVFKAYHAPVEAAGAARSTQASAADINAVADVDAADTPTITINTFAGDNIINYAEGQVEQVLSGTTTGIEAGQSLTVAFNSIVSFWTEVQADGSWQLTLNAASMYDLLRYGSTEITAESANAAGEEATVSVPFQVLSDWPSVTLNAFAGDNVISGPEDQATQILSGSTSRVEAGQTVTLTLNGNTYTATVDADGYWRTSVPAADVAALPDGAQLVATVTNALGREAGDSATLTVNSSLPSLTVDPFATDNVLSDAEAQSAQTLSGTTTGVEAGQAVTVTLNEITYSTTVAADGSFSLSVPSADLLALYSGQTTIAARAANLAGQETQGSEILTVDFATARLVVDPVAGDNYINASESSYLVLSGTTVDVPAGSWVVITFNDRIFRAEVEADGSWSTYVSDLVVNSFPDGQYPITFSAPGSAPVTLDVGLYIDNQAQLNVQIDTLFGDDVLTPGETLQDQVLTGTTGITGAGQTISAELEGVTHTGSVDNDGNWTITVPAAALQALQNPNGYVYVQAADLAGNSIAVGRSFELVFSPATLTIDPITGDNILTAAETATPLTVSGVSYRVPEGVTITVTLNGKEYTTTAPGNDTWSVQVPAADLAGLTDGVYTVTAATINIDLEPVTTQQDLTVDLAPAPAFSVDPVTGDDILYVDETSGEIVITGRAPVSAVGGSVTVTAFDDPAYRYTGTVAADGTWQVTVPEYNFGGTSNGVYTLVAELTAPDGTTTTTTHDITINVWPFSGDFYFDDFTGDSTLTAEERTQDQVFSGTFASEENDVSGLGITVYMHDNDGQTFAYTGTTDGNGRWSVTIPAADLQQLSEGWSYMTATATDAAGNGASSSREADFAVLPATGGTITVNPIAGDNVLTADEISDGLTISGSSTYMGERYTQIEVEINGTLRIYADYESDWSVTFSREFIATLPDGPLTVTASGYDLSGNRVTTTATLEVNLSDVSTLTLDPVTGDDVISADEAGGEIVITGRAPLSTQGGTVTVTAFDDPAYRYTATVEEGGTWQATVPAGAFSGRANGVYTLVAELTAPDGTVTTLNHDVTSNQLPFSGGFAFYVFAGDDVLNAEEQAQDQILEGEVFSDDGGNVAGLAVTIQMTTFDGQQFTYTTTTGENGYWQVTLPSSDLEQLRNGWVNLVGTVADGAGNTLSNESQFTVLAGIGTLTINPIAGDNVLTADEIGNGLVVSGSGEFLDMPLSLEVTINGVSQGFSDYSSDWSVTFTPQQLAGFPDGPLTVTVTAYDIEFNLITATSTLTVDLGDLQPLTFNPFGGDDNYLDEDELESDQLLSGQAGNLAAGSIVTLTLGEFTYQAEVQADHSWSVLIPSADLQTLPNDATTGISATVTDADGNLLAAGSHTFLLYRTPGELNIDTLAGNGILTADEATVPLVISGTITNGRVGAAVTVDLNGHLYQTTVTASDGSWQVSVPVEDLAQLGNTEYWVSATSTDLSGNEINGLNLLVVDLYVPVITLDPIAGDNIINAAEAAAGVVLSGQSSEAGGVVSVQLNGVAYEAGVDEEGSWQLALPNSALAELEDGRYTLTLSQTGFNGQTTTVTESLLLDADPANRPVLRIHTISHDNVLNGAELQSDQIITGSSENVESGQTLSLKIGGVTYTTQVQPGGGWSLIVPAEDLAALGDGGLTLRAGVTDASGNRATASRNLTIKSDRDGLSIDPVTGDNLINAADAEGAITLTGHTDGVRHGATVRLTLNGEHYTAKVGKDGSWSAKVPAADVAALEEGSATLTACVKSACGQMLYAKAVLTVDTRAPELALLPVTGDNLISLQEAQAGFALTGSAGIAAAGLLVLVVLNGVEYQGKVQASGDWTVAIPAGTLADQPAGDYPLTVSLTDTAGNLTSLTSVVTLEAAPDADATETAALTVTSQTVAASADSTLTSALAVPDTATDTADGTYAIGGQTLTLTESGGEALGGSGNDTILLNTLDFLHIDGGSGTDTLLLAGSDQHLDLTTLGLKIENIDIFDLGNGSNSLTLGLHEAETVRDTPEESLFIRGQGGSQLTLAGDNTWETSGQREVGGLLFDVYHATGLESADLLVQQGILVQQG
ncbi:Ig-like domain-containing protein [Chimaeribacter arupi]|uniref:Biofilm-associated protein BapA-like prefix-like domain-containing protein n=1 Tax=Chimaeribacter arupi TaxID=2060066 RepID=A0A2N5EPT0_9GAMM|nr:hypothetical protein CYR34_06975 [Chimaeribacter arupi]